MEVTPEGHRVEQYWWTADGSTLFYTEHRGRGHSPELWAFRPSESKSQLIYKAAGREYLSSFSSDDAGTSVCLPGRKQHLATANCCDGQGDEAGSNSRRFESCVFASSRWERPSASKEQTPTEKTGLRILLNLSISFQASSYPLIVTTYRSGDYFLRGASGDENPIQVYAAHGFAVLSFDVGWLRNPGWRRFRRKASRLGISGGVDRRRVERLAKDGIIDPAKVGIAGYSHGEEIAGYAVTHTNLFRAASGAAGYDPCFYFLGSDEWHDVFEEWGLGGWPEGKSRENWRRDCHVDECR